MIKQKTIQIQNRPSSLNWINNELVDWVSGGNRYTLNGQFKNNGIRYAYKFDTAIQSDNGVYVVLYEAFGTKGIILKNGEIIREINRSFYHAEHTAYPVALLKLKNGKYGIIHCPNQYNLIEIEEIESGKMITSAKHRSPDDCFHSNFMVNNDNTYLLSNGWVWHPWMTLDLYNIEKGLIDNAIFDKSYMFQENPEYFSIDSEVIFAEFISNDLILISSLKRRELSEDERSDITTLHPGQTGVFSIIGNSFIKKITLAIEQGGGLIPIDENMVFCLSKSLKLIDLNTGKTLHTIENIIQTENYSPIAVDINNKRIAIGTENTIEIIQIK